VKVSEILQVIQKQKQSSGLLKSVKMEDFGPPKIKSSVVCEGYFSYWHKECAHSKTTEHGKGAENLMKKKKHGQIIPQTADIDRHHESVFFWGGPTKTIKEPERQRFEGLELPFPCCAMRLQTEAVMEIPLEHWRPSVSAGEKFSSLSNSNQVDRMGVRNAQITPLPERLAAVLVSPLLRERCHFIEVKSSKLPTTIHLSESHTHTHTHTHMKGMRIEKERNTQSTTSHRLAGDLQLQPEGEMLRNNWQDVMDYRCVRKPVDPWQLNLELPQEIKSPLGFLRVMFSVAVPIQVIPKRESFRYCNRTRRRWGSGPFYWSCRSGVDNPFGVIPPPPPPVITTRSLRASSSSFRVVRLLFPNLSQSDIIGREIKGRWDGRRPSGCPFTRQRGSCNYTESTHRSADAAETSDLL